MALLDKREPAVYVNVEDASYVAPTLENGRVGYVVIMCDRGPHNRIVKVTSQEEFHKLFGKPNIKRCSQSFYVADKFLQYSNNLLVCRIAPDPYNVTLKTGESAGAVYAYVANSAIVTNIPRSSTGNFKFINEGGKAEIKCQDEEAYNEIRLGMYIYSNTDAAHPEYAGQVIEKLIVYEDDEPYHVRIGTRVYNSLTKQYVYTYQEYGGTESTDWEKAYITYAPTSLTSFSTPTASTVGSTGDQYKFINNANYIVAESDAAANAVYLGRWIYKLTESAQSSYRVVSKIKQTTGTYKGKTFIYLDRTYSGVTSSAYESIKMFAPTRFHFVSGSKYVYCGSSAFQSISSGDWIYPSNIVYNYARQVYVKESFEISEVINGVTRTETVYRLTLDSAYETTTALDMQIYKYRPFAETYFSTTNPESREVDSDPSIVFYFYANGAGSYYNNIKIIGSRNTELERMHVNDDGTPKYKYAFMNIGIYQYINGNYTLLEGPWEVSLIPRTPDTNEIIRNYSTGQVLFIEEVINNNSQYVRCMSGKGLDHLMSSVDSQDKRLQCMLQLCYTVLTSDGTAILKTGAAGLYNVGDNGVILKNGSDGLMFELSTGTIVYSNRMNGMAKLAYQAYGFTSVDGTVEQMQEYAYPWYQPDYILAGGWPAEVQDGARQLADLRNDCIVLADTGTKYTSPSQDIAARTSYVPWNSWNSMLYVQYREIFDAYTGERFWITPVYHAIERHLYCDGQYWISEPVAGIEKGAISEPIKLAYKANHTQRGDLLDAELNCTIFEPQGTYFLTQFTTWKRLSILKRAHAAKFVCYLRKTIPTLLKDILQRKATSYWINQAKMRVDTFMAAFLENPALERYSSIKSYSVKVNFDDVRSELNVYVTIVPIRAIERIHVFIQVV